jgi:hypothetical protein
MASGGNPIDAATQSHLCSFLPNYSLNSVLNSAVANREGHIVFIHESTNVANSTIQSKLGEISSDYLHTIITVYFLLNDIKQSA